MKYVILALVIFVMLVSISHAQEPNWGIDSYRSGMYICNYQACQYGYNGGMYATGINGMIPTYGTVPYYYTNGQYTMNPWVMSGIGDRENFMNTGRLGYGNQFNYTTGGW